MLVKLDQETPSIGMKMKKKLSCHHLVKTTVSYVPPPKKKDNQHWGSCICMWKEKNTHVFFLKEILLQVAKKPEVKDSICMYVYIYMRNFALSFNPGCPGFPNTKLAKR